MVVREEIAAGIVVVAAAVYVAGNDGGGRGRGCRGRCGGGRVKGFLFAFVRVVSFARRFFLSGGSILVDTRIINHHSNNYTYITIPW